MNINEIKKIAIQNLKRDKHLVQAFLFLDEHVNVIPVNYKNDEEKDKIIEAFKKIVKEKNITKYWHVAEAWVSSNPHVNRPRDDLYREEVLMISEYTKDNVKEIAIPFKRKNNEIKMKKERHLEDGTSVSRFNVFQNKDINKIDMRTYDLINRIKEANMSEFCKKFKNEYIKKEKDKEKIEKVKNLTEKEIKDTLIKNIKKHARKGEIINIPNGILPRNLMRDDEKMKKDIIDMKDKETNTCPDCGVEPGEYHKIGCDVERCPTCGGQLISCSHKPLHKDRMKWNGKWPFSEFCEKEGIDLNDLYSDYKWNKKTKTWTKLSN